MGEPFRVQARCGTVLGNVSVQCRPDSTVDEVLERMLRCQGASTSAPDMVSFWPIRVPSFVACLRLICHVSRAVLGKCVQHHAVFMTSAQLVAHLLPCVQSVTYRGRPCGALSTLNDLGIVSGSSVDIALRLRGGGGDGGATGAESRISYLEMYASKKPDKVRFRRGV